MVGRGASLEAAPIGCSSSTTCSLSSCIKIYMSMSKNQWVHKIPNKTILHGGIMTFSKKVRHTCTSAGERWVRDDLDWVLFKNHSLTRSSCIKWYIFQCQQNNGCTKKLLACTKKTILHGGTMTFSKKVRHTCTLGRERWVSNDPDWVLFNNHSFTIKLHKIIYMSMSAYQWGKQGKIYLHVQKKYN